MPTSLARTALSFVVVLVLAMQTQAHAAGEPAPALLARLDCARHRVQSVAFSPDGKLLAAGYGLFADGGVTIWRLADRSVVTTLADASSPNVGVNLVAFSPDGKLFAVATDRGSVMVWRVGIWDSHKTVLESRGKAEDLAFSPDSARLAYSSDAEALIIDLPTGRVDVVVRDSDHGSRSRGISFSPDGRSLLVFADSEIRVLDAKSLKTISVWDGPATGFLDFGRMVPSGRSVISGGGPVFGSKSVEIRSYPDGSIQKRLTEFRSGIFDLDVSHSGKLFAIAGGNYGSGGDLSLFETNGGREFGFVSSGTLPFQGVSFSPDDRVLAAASEDGAVLLYDVARIHGPDVKKQDFALCGEVLVEGGKTFIVPLSKVPVPMSEDFQHAWKIEVANADAVSGLEGSPVALQEWAIESGAATDRARVGKVKMLSPRGHKDDGAASRHVTFGDVQNPGWDKGVLVKIYGDGTFVAATNTGKCLSYGRLEQIKKDFASIESRLLAEGLLYIPRDPLTIGADHYRTTFIELQSKGVSEVRSDADAFQVLMKGTSKKRETFSRVFALEEPFIKSLVEAGFNAP